MNSVSDIFQQHCCNANSNLDVFPSAGWSNFVLNSINCEKKEGDLESPVVHLPGPTPLHSHQKQVHHLQHLPLLSVQPNGGLVYFLDWHWHNLGSVYFLETVILINNKWRNAAWSISYMRQYNWIIMTKRRGLIYFLDADNKQRCPWHWQYGGWTVVWFVSWWEWYWP